LKSGEKIKEVGVRAHLRVCKIATNEKTHENI
jgi:hypothetical protein